MGLSRRMCPRSRAADPGLQTRAQRLRRCDARPCDSYDPLAGAARRAGRGGGQFSGDAGDPLAARAFGAARAVAVRCVPCAAGCARSGAAVECCRGARAVPGVRRADRPAPLADRAWLRVRRRAGGVGGAGAGWAGRRGVRVAVADARGARSGIFRVAQRVDGDAGGRGTGYRVAGRGAAACGPGDRRGGGLCGVVADRGGVSPDPQARWARRG